MLHGLSCGEEAGARKPCVFPYKVAAADDERYLVCAGGCGWGRFMRELVPPMCFATSGCVCLRSYAFLESLVVDRIGMAA